MVPVTPKEFYKKHIGIFKNWHKLEKYFNNKDTYLFLTKIFKDRNISFNY